RYDIKVPAKRRVIDRISIWPDGYRIGWGAAGLPIRGQVAAIAPATAMRKEMLDCDLVIFFELLRIERCLLVEVLDVEDRLNRRPVARDRAAVVQVPNRVRIGRPVLPELHHARCRDGLAHAADAEPALERRIRIRVFRVSKGAEVLELPVDGDGE